MYLRRFIGWCLLFQAADLTEQLEQFREQLIERDEQLQQMQAQIVVSEKRCQHVNELEDKIQQLQVKSRGSIHNICIVISTQELMLVNRSSKCQYITNVHQWNNQAVHALLPCITGIECIL